MSHQPAPRSLSLTEELERLEQSITLTLQEIDESFSKAHRIVTTSILPIVDQYAKHSNDVWEGSKFWKQFFEASANVSLSGYEEPAVDDTVQTEATVTDAHTPSGHDMSSTSESQTHDEDDETFSIDSPTQMSGPQSTPRLQGPKGKAASGRTPITTSRTTTARSPSPRKYIGQNPAGIESLANEPSTPRHLADSNIDADLSSPFEPESAFQPTSAARMRSMNDPIMHRAVLDKNYRIQATPHTQQRVGASTAGAGNGRTPAGATSTKPLQPWDDSPMSSPIAAAPQLRSELFSPAKTGKATHRIPGVSVLTPAAMRTKTTPVRTTSTGRRLFSPDDKSYSATKAARRFGFDSKDDDDEEINYDFDDDTLDDTLDMSPPKTMQFHVPQSRLLQTPAREASRRIVEDILLTAGADATDDIEDEGRQARAEFEASPSVIRGRYSVEDDTF